MQDEKSGCQLNRQQVHIRVDEIPRIYHWMQWSQLGKQMCCQKVKRLQNICISLASFLFIFVWFNWYSQIEWIKKENQIFAFIVTQRDFLKLTIDHSSWGKVRSWFTDLWAQNGVCLFQHGLTMVGHLYLEQVKIDKHKLKIKLSQNRE